jgi:SAM-dependent methyltransferase
MSHQAAVTTLLPIPLELESCPCPACASRDCTGLLNFDSFGFPIGTVECDSCGQVYSNPRPTRAYLEDFYASKYLYFYEGIRGVSQAYVRRHSLEELAAMRLRRYAEYLAPHTRLLDVGCGSGLFLAAVRRDFPEAAVAGIDPDPSAAVFCRQQLGLTVQQGFFETCTAPETWDVISAFHVLEHLHDLPAFFQAVRRSLRPGGLFFAECPNLDGSWRGIGMFHLAHLQAFSPRTLENLFLRFGFEVVAAEAIEHPLDPSNLFVVAAARPGGGSPARDPAESERIRLRCRHVRAFRTARISRTWAKWAYRRLQQRLLTENEGI